MLREREIMQVPFGDRPAVVHVNARELGITTKPMIVDLYRAMSEHAALLPFYAVCDASASMRDGTRIDALNAAIASTCDAIALNPVIADRVRFGIVGFSGEADVELPLCDVALLDALPQLVPRGLTAYGAAFTLLRRTIENDVAQLVADGFRVFRPAVFFLTDGRPTDAAPEWRSALAALLDRDFPHRPNIVAFGFGDADPRLLGEIATVAAYAAADALTAAAAIASFGTLLVESVVASGTAGGFRLPDRRPGRAARAGRGGPAVRPGRARRWLGPRTPLARGGRRHRRGARGSDGGRGVQALPRPRGGRRRACCGAFVAAGA